jgi:hypothetical protein
MKYIVKVNMKNYIALIIFSSVLIGKEVNSFSPNSAIWRVRRSSSSSSSSTRCHLDSTKHNDAAQSSHNPEEDRRSVLKNLSLFTLSNILVLTSTTQSAFAAEMNNSGGKSFAPGGTLVEYEVGVQVGNPMASKSRKVDNSNVVFGQDYYFKFGTAPSFIEPGNTDFPKTMPFTPSQQRYETMKKYRDRVQRGIDLIGSLGETIEKGDYKTIANGSAPEYSIRPMGLLANGFLASENTGTTNELFLSRWYINEIYLDINDIESASCKEEALKSYMAAKKALNSYLTLINRVITSKVGDPFSYVT